MLKISDFFFHSFGTGCFWQIGYVLVALSSSSLMLDISGFEEIGSKLKTSSFVDGREFHLE
jgi:hypothetical protein